MTKLSRAAATVAYSFMIACSSAGPAPTQAPVPLHPGVSLADVRDSVTYIERSEAATFIARPGDTLIVSSNQTAAFRVVRTAADTLEAEYEYLRMQFASPSEVRSVDTRSVVGSRFLLHHVDGRIETVRAPDLSPELRQLSDLRRQFDDFFLRRPARPLEVGAEWVDTLVRSGTEAEASSERRVVTRFRVRGDTTIEGLSGRVIDYEAAIESSLRSAPTTQGTLVSEMAGGEEGTIVYAPERELMLSRSRIGVLEGELRVEGNLETQTFPQTYSYESTVEVVVPRARPEPRPAPTPQP